MGHIDYVTSQEYIASSVYEEAMRRGKPAIGDIVITTEAPLGMVASIDREDIALAQRVIKYRAHANMLSNNYLKFYFLSPRFQRILDENSSGTTAKGIKGSRLHKLPVALPPLPEQKAIAEALGDVDALTESLEQLIAKKKQTKQGAMQELLTGKRRLPGFSGEWEEKKLGELFVFSGGLSASRDQLSSEGLCYLHYGDIHLSNKSYIDVANEYASIPKLPIALKDVAAKSLLDDGDVAFVDASEDDEGASKHVVISNKHRIPLISGLHTIVAKRRDAALESEFLRHCFQTQAIKDQFKFFAVGTKVSGISKTNIAKIILKFPDAKEQLEIGRFLSEMDSEISALEQKLSKTRAIKQGMMQELLTGRIRLV
jgi:type I restriction enzyme S subunit